MGENGSADVNGELGFSGSSTLEKRKIGKGKEQKAGC